jgi:uncharacterized protein YdhG (YjbR/CyaY superfamily)
LRETPRAARNPARLSQQNQPSRNFMHLTPPAMEKNKPLTIDEYIENAPVYAQEKLSTLRALLKELVPDAAEAIKWGTPVFEEKRILFAFAGHKNHINFIPTHASLAPFEKELSKMVTGKDTIQLPYDKPLPVTLIRKIAKHRIRDVRENDARWM